MRLSPPLLPSRQPVHALSWLLPGTLAWLAIWLNLTRLADLLTGWSGLAPDGRAGRALHFFFYETPKVLMLLVAAVFVMGVVQSFFTPQRTRALLSGRRGQGAHALSAALGVVTPFCSCSAVPLFIGFLSAGVPLGVTFTFLIAAPMVNEVALVLLLTAFGWKVALLYLALGLGIAVLAGLIIGALRMERHLEDWVQALAATPAAEAERAARPGWTERLQAGRTHVRQIVGKVWPYVLLGIALGAGIHGYVPDTLLAAIMGREAWWSVPAAVLLGVPMYSGAAGMLPVVQALIGKGAAPGTALAFMMAVIALSAPEMIILRKVLKPRLIATFIAIVATGIILVGYLFNTLL